MSDILGPADAPNAVTIRPVETRTFSSNDTFFRDCSTLTSDDGTDVQAVWLNGIVAALRSIARSNGAIASDSTIKIVPEVGTDDDIITKAVQHLIQRDRPKYGLDTGTANALVVTLAPAPAELLPGFAVRVKLAHDITAASTLKVNGFGPYPIVHPDGAGTGTGDGFAGEVAEFRFDGTNMQKVGLSGLVLSAPRTYYVDAALGSDANDGRLPGAGHAFQTIQHAIDVVSKYNLNGFNVTISVADFLTGTYAPFVCTSVNGSGAINIIGNTTTYANVTVAANTGPAAQGEAGRGYTLSGMKFTAAAQDPVSARPGAGVWAKPGCTVGVSFCEFGYCYDAHMDAQGGTIAFAGTIRISGGSNTHLFASNGGTIYSTGVPLTSLVVAAAVSIGTFAAAAVNAIVIPVYSAMTGKANVSGSKFNAAMNGAIATSTGDVNYLPGSTAGVADSASGGRYN